MRLYEKGCKGYGVAFGKAGQTVLLYDEQITVPEGYLAVTWYDSAGKVVNNCIVPRKLLTVERHS